MVIGTAGGPASDGDKALTFGASILVLDIMRAIN